MYTENQIYIFVPQNEAIIFVFQWILLPLHWAPALPTVVSEAVTPGQASLNRALLLLTIDPAASSGALGHSSFSLFALLLSRDNQSVETTLMPNIWRGREQFDFNCQPVHWLGKSDFDLLQGKRACNLPRYPRAGL